MASWRGCFLYLTRDRSLFGQFGVVTWGCWSILAWNMYKYSMKNFGKPVGLWAKHEAFRESRFVPWHLPVLLSLSLTLTIFFFLFRSFFLPPTQTRILTHSVSHLYSSIAPSINNRVVGNHETAYRVWTTDSTNEKRVHRYYHQGSFKIMIVSVFLSFVSFVSFGHFKLRFLEFSSDRLTRRDCFVLFVSFLLSW